MVSCDILASVDSMQQVTSQKSTLLQLVDQLNNVPVRQLDLRSEHMLASPSAKQLATRVDTAVTHILTADFSFCTVCKAACRSSSDKSSIGRNRDSLIKARNFKHQTGVGQEPRASDNVAMGSRLEQLHSERRL